MSYYIDALQSLGGSEAVVEDLAKKRVAVFAEGLQIGLAKSWWENMLLACSDAQLGRVSEAIATLDRIEAARGFPSLPDLQDSPCFKRIASEPRYIALIAHLKERQRLLRERLPATLTKYGVADVHP
jgi:hypothetical protein